MLPVFLQAQDAGNLKPRAPGLCAAEQALGRTFGVARASGAPCCCAAQTGPQEVCTPPGSDLSLLLGVWVPRPLETQSSLEAEQPWGLRHLTALASSLNHCCPFSLTPPSTRAVTQLLTQGISHPLQSVQGSSPSPCFSQACRGLGSEAH